MNPALFAFLRSRPILTTLLAAGLGWTVGQLLSNRLALLYTRCCLDSDATAWTVILWMITAQGGLPFLALTTAAAIISAVLWLRARRP